MVFPIEEKDLKDPVMVNFSATRIMCFLVYPDSKKEREEAINLLKIETIEHLKDMPIDGISNPNVKEIVLNDPQKWQEHKEKYVQNNMLIKSELPCDLTKILLNSNSLIQIRKIMTSDEINKQWNTVYFITKTLLCMHIHGTAKRGGASIKKALFLLERADLDPENYARNEKDARKAWNKFQPVCHLLIAYMHAQNNSDSDYFYIYDPEGLRFFLGLAKIIQDLLFDIKIVQNKNQPMFTESNFYRISSELELPKVSCNFTPLVQKHQDILDQYQYQKY